MGVTQQVSYKQDKTSKTLRKSMRSLIWLHYAVVSTLTLVALSKIVADTILFFTIIFQRKYGLAFHRNCLLGRQCT